MHAVRCSRAVAPAHRLEFACFYPRTSNAIPMNWFPGLPRGTKTPSGSDASRRAKAGGGQAERLRALIAQGSEAERRAHENELGQALARGDGTLLATDSEAVVGAAVCHAEDNSLALQWMERLQDEARLAEVAIGARSAQLRFAAAQRLSDGALLERVAAGTRERDKRVHRHCSEILRSRIEHADRAQRASELQASLEALVDEPPPLAATRLAQAERSVQALGDCAEAAPCREQLARLYARMRDESETLRQLHRSAERADALAAETAAEPWPIADRLGPWRDELAALEAANAALPSWTQVGASARALQEALAALGTRLRELEQDLERHSACESFLSAQDGDPDPAAWDALPKPRHAAARKMLETKWMSRLQQSHAQREAARNAAVAAEKSKPKPALDLAAMQKALFALEQALAQGRTAEAERAEARIEHLLGALTAPRGLDARWKRARSELVRLRGWARWGSTQAHDQLIAHAEKDLAEPMEIEALAQAIARFREEWKRLDASGAAPRAQWERFDALMEKAYQPVAAHRAAQAAEQQKTRAAREAQLAQWEAWIRALDWAQADWRAVERKRAEMLAAWHSGARAGFRDERALRKRFDPLVAELEARLAEARSAETARRQALIDQAEALREARDLGEAIAQARTLQAKWRDEAGSAYLGRRKDEVLWKKFRAACDAVFARRDAQRAERAAQSEQVVQARRALLKTLEDALAAPKAGEIEAALAQFQAAWKSAAALPREAAGDLERQARQITQRASERMGALKLERHAARYTVLAQKAQLAERVEEAAAAGSDAAQALAQAREAWAVLPALAADAERALAKRLEAASSASPESLAQGLAQRAQLLLELELALDLPSPAAHAEARRTRQLLRLKERFASGGGAAETPAQMLTRCYATPAAADTEQAERLAIVQRKLVETENRASRKPG